MGKQKRKEINIAGKIVGENRPVFIIAEAGVNHNGDLKLAKKMIDAASDAGVDAIKFQTFIAEEENTKEMRKVTYQKSGDGDSESFIDMIKKLEFGEKEWRVLMDYCRQKGIIFFSTPSEEKSARLLNNLDIPVFKIASNDIVTIPMLEEIASFGKPMILSTGMSDLPEIREALEAVRSRGNDKIIVLHCTSNYPCAFKNVNLSAMQAMREELDILVGYSDHTQGIEVSVMAVALGACMIEKHFTLNRNLPGPDHKASLEPDEFKEMVKAIRNTEKMSFAQKEKLINKNKRFFEIMGSPEKKLLESEKEAVLMCRKSIVARRGIKKGKLITLDDIAFKRPGTGILPKHFHEFLGKIAQKDILEDTMIAEEMFE